MKRYEFVIDGGKEELARAISFCVVRALTDKLDISCEDFIDLVESVKPDYEAWLEEEIDDST